MSRQKWRTALFVLILLIIGGLPGEIEYREVQKEYYNEVHESDSISVYYSPEYFTLDGKTRGEIWY